MMSWRVALVSFGGALILGDSAFFGLSPFWFAQIAFNAAQLIRKTKKKIETEGEALQGDQRSNHESKELKRGDSAIVDAWNASAEMHLRANDSIRKTQMEFDEGR